VTGFPDAPALFDELDHSPVLAIVHAPTPAETAGLCQRAWALGIALVEVPLRDDGDLALLAGAVALGSAFADSPGEQVRALVKHRR
jgi:2-keto-3-deoxy-6-phosphogluconate aldolase